jgi:hypothetical protein
MVVPFNRMGDPFTPLGVKNEHTKKLLPRRALPRLRTNVYRQLIIIELGLSE